MSNDFIYRINEIDYPVVVTYKKIKNIIYKFKDGSFYISSPMFVSKDRLIKGLNKFASALIKEDAKKNSAKPVGEDYLFFLGEKYHYINSVSLINEDGKKMIKFSDNQDLNSKLISRFNDLVVTKIRYYENLMNTKKHKIRIKKMTSRYGSNSRRTLSIAINLELIHYSIEIIESVIVHELAHDFYFDHSKNFYNVVYKFCPNYNELTKKLKRKIYR